MTWLAIAAAAVGACCFAVAAWLQQGAVSTVTGGAGLRPAGWGRVLTQRRWLTGFGLTALGAALHATALGLAPLVVVQPVGVLAIGLTTLLAARSTGRRLGGPTVLAVAASTLGVGMFVTLAATGSSTPALPAGVESRAGLIAALVVAGLAALGRMAAGGRTRCLAFASAAGVAFGLVSVLVHSIAVRLEAGGPGRPHVVSVAMVVAAALAGCWFAQHAYATGSPHVVVACQTVVDPMFGVGIGIGLLGEARPVLPVPSVGLIACAVLAVAGVLGLARHNPLPHHRAPSSSMESTVTDTLPESPSPARFGMSAERPLRIVIGADTFPPDINGASRFAERLAGGLGGRGHEVHVLCAATGARSTTESVDGVVLHRVMSRSTPFHPTFRFCPPWRAFRAAAELLDDLTPDVVHVQAHFLLGRGLVRAAGRRGIPVIATNHFMPENLFGYARVPGWLRAGAARLGWWDLRQVFGRAHAVTAPTPRAVRLLTRHGLPGAVAVSCGIDVSRFHRPAQRPNGSARRRVLFVGRLDEEKRVDDLLRAVGYLYQRVDGGTVDLRVEIVGDGTHRAAWQRLAERLGIAARVTFHGFVDEDTLVAAYARCDVFCMPGVAELQSLATMEAMAAGKPVIAADAMALPHLVRPGRNGWLYPPGDVPALAGHLLRLCTDRDGCARMGAVSRQLVSEHTMDRTLDSFESLYRAALGHRAVARRANPAVA